MALSFLTNADFPAIRAAIRSDLGASDLPDVLVSYALGPASSQVAAIDTQAPWPDGSDEAQRDHDAAVLYAAAYLLGSIPQVMSERFQDYSYTLAPFNAAERADVLRQLAAGLLAANLGKTALQLMRSTSMALAPGGRGDISDSGPSVPETLLIGVSLP